MDIKKARDNREISQKKLAEQIGVTPQAVCMWERGKRKVPAEILPSIAAALGCTIDELYGKEG